MDDFNAVNKKYHENIWLQNVLIPLLLKDLYRYNENGGSSFATLMKTNINDETDIKSCPVTNILTLSPNIND